MKYKILILGKGYIGTAISDALRLDHEVIHIAKKEINYTNPSTLKLFLDVGKFDYVINASGYTGKPNVDQAEKEKVLCWELNVVNAVDINRVCIDKGVNYIHIGSGCIYNNIIDAMEGNMPNFGLYSNESSFYSKSKHAYETIAGDSGLTLRIRMPFDNTLSLRNYLYKLRTYPKLMGANEVNSRTYIHDLTRFINYIVTNNFDVNHIGPLNFVNPGSVSTQYIVEDYMEWVNFSRSTFQWVDENDLNLAAKRSNCTLAITKLRSIFPNFNITEESEAILTCLKDMRDL